MLCQAREAQAAPNKAQKDRLLKTCGIKGVSILSHFKSISFSLSFLYDFMHVIWENLIPNLVLFWTGGFKASMKGLENISSKREYGSNRHGNSGSRRGTFGARPPNPATNKAALSVDAWVILDSLSWSCAPSSRSTSYRTTLERYF